MTQAKFFEEKEDFEDEEIPKPRKPGEAPDGGWGWVVIIGSFLCNLFIEGLVFSFPYLQEEVGEYYNVSLQSAGTVGTLLMGFSLLAGPLASALVNKFGCRKVTILGSAITCVALLVSTHMPDIALLRFTYGFLAGTGLSLIYLPSVVCIAMWFDNKRALATGLALMGSQVGTFIFPPLYKHLLQDNDWKITTVIMGGLVMNCAVGGALFRPLTKAKQKGMKRGVIQRGAIMKALIAEKERQRTISNGSLDNCIITKDNRLIKIDKIDLRNKSNSYINRLKETFGFSSRSLNRSKNSLIVPKVVVTDPIYKPKSSPRPVPKISVSKAASTPPTPKRDSDSGCGSLDSPSFKAKSYEQIPLDDPWCKSVSMQETDLNKASVSLANINTVNSPKKCADDKLDPSFLSNNSTPAGSANSLNSKLVDTGQSGKNLLLPFTGSVMASVVPSGEMMYHEEDKNYKFLRKLCKHLELHLMTMPSFVILVIANFCVMLAFRLACLQLPVKAQGLGITPENSLFLISILCVANMIGRLVFAWFADRPWASSVHLNNVCVIIAGLLSFLSPMYVDNGGLSFYAAFFGLFTATFVALRSIFLIELYGLEKLPGCFGLLIMFQGLAVVAGSFISEDLSVDICFHVVGGLLCLAAVIGMPLPRLRAWEADRAHMLEIIKIEEVEMQPTETVEKYESTI